MSYSESGMGSEQQDALPDAPYPPSAPSGMVLRSSLSTTPHYATRFGSEEQPQAASEVKPINKFVSIRTSPYNPHLFAAINLHDEKLRVDSKLGKGASTGSLLCQVNQISMKSSLEDRLRGRLWQTHEQVFLSRGNPQLGPSIASTCLSWSPTRLQVATGLTTGNLCIHTFTQTGGFTSGSTGTHQVSQEQFSSGRNKRAATAVAFRPNMPNHVALGLMVGGSMAHHSHHQRKPRATDFGCLLWDINSSSPAAAPVLKVCHNAGVASLSWLHDGQTLVVGCQVRQLQIYDLRSTSSPPMTVRGAHHEAVQGACVDPTNANMLATYGASQGDPVKLWDLRRIETPLSELKVAAAPSAIAWSRPGVLSVAVENRILHFEATSSKPISVGQTHVERRVMDMTMVPNQDRFLVVLDDKSVRDVSKHTLSPLALSKQDGCVVHAFGSQVWKSINTVSDISTVMKERASCTQSARYSLNATTNVELLSSNPENQSLVQLWRWIGRMESNQTNMLALSSALNLTAGGVCNLMEFDNPDATEDVAKAECLAMELYDSAYRRAALAACGWTATDDENAAILKECEKRGEYERAAALAVWHDNVCAAVEILARGSNKSDHASLLQLVSLGIAGYNGSNSSVWQQACSSLLEREELKRESNQQSVAYLHALLRFLLATDDEGGLKSVLEDGKLNLCDRVGFACRFLRRSELRTQLDKWLKLCQDKGNVEGLVLTGLDLDGIKILQAFVDRTGDVQTATLVTSRVIMPPSWSTERKVCSEWLEGYRGLLNSWQMWQSRAMFDVDRADLLRKLAQSTKAATRSVAKASVNQAEPDSVLNPTIPAQLDARCNYCSVSLSGARKQDGLTNQWLARSKNVLSCCPRCRKPLPRCAICLLSLGCLNPYMELRKAKSSRNGGNESLSNLPFAEWFTWCMRCKHGGHAHHLVGWFSNHDTCPVSGCDCNCQFDGIQKLSHQQKQPNLLQTQSNHDSS